MKKRHIRNDLKHIEERLAGEKSSSEKMLNRQHSLNKRLKELSAEKTEKEQALLNLKQK